MCRIPPWLAPGGVPCLERARLLLQPNFLVRCHAAAGLWMERRFQMGLVQCVRSGHNPRQFSELLLLAPLPVNSGDVTVPAMSRVLVLFL